MAAQAKVDLTRPVKSQAASGASPADAEKAAAEAADQAAADQLAADEAAQAAAAAKTALTDTKLVRAIHTVGIAGGKMKIPGDEFELASGVADELEGMGIVAFLEDVEIEEAIAAKKAARKAK